MTETEKERAAVVALLDKILKETLIGKTRPEFLCKTPAKANMVIALILASISTMIENGDHAA